MSTVIYSIIALVVLVILYNIYKFYNKRRIIYREEKTVVKLVHDATQHKLISGNSIPTSKYSNEYAISFWMYVDNYDYRFKHKKIVILNHVGLIHILTSIALNMLQTKKAAT